MSVIKINGNLFKKMIIAGANELNRNKQLVDSLNVFPVPDGDTGTNMSLTVLAAAKECEKSNSLSIEEMAKLASNGALRGARGNSGVITSQLFRGFAKGLEGLNEAGTKELAIAIRKGVKTAYKAVMKPKEGTILTVARACAESAEKVSQETDDVELFLKRILEEAHVVLLQTTDMLPVLKQAGVVDAGGKGLLCILEGAYESINDKKEYSVDAPKETIIPNFSALASVENQSITFGYCTEFFINVVDVKESDISKFKSYLGTIGDSIVVVHDEEIMKIHVHTDHPGLALERAMEMGSLSGLKIDNMREQHTNKIDFKHNVISKNDENIKKHIGVVSISVGSGLSEIFKNLGTDEIIEGGQTMNPSTEDILNAIERISANTVIVLPNNKNIILAAQQAANLVKNKEVFVIPSTTIPEGISALIQFSDDPDTLSKTITSMTEAIAYVTTATVTYAVRDTSLDGNEISEGDILGMLDGEIAVVEKNVAIATKSLLHKTIEENTELVSIYYGQDIQEEDAKELLDYAKTEFLDCEIEMQRGDQPLYYYIISAE